MRKIWVKVDPWDKEMVKTALEGGADGIMVPTGYSDQVKALGRIQTIAEDGDLKPNEDVIIYQIQSGTDEEEIVRLSRDKQVILESTDWSIIPLENLIAKGADVIAPVENLKEAETAFGILEKGVSHILFTGSDPVELKKTLSWIKAKGDQVPLEVAEVIDVQPAGMGDRVCVDTCTDMKPGEGMLVGNSSRALFLVHAESIENPYVAPRPFRVNAGAVHAYTRVADGKTRYLSELKSGDQILITDFQGNISVGTVGRLKIERRPLVLLRANVGGTEASTILQNAETIRLTDPDGKAASIVSLKPGDKILAAIEEAGRHFGMKIDETITEK
ncbi:MAG: 3-dehydroquinate synthase II [Desulfobacterales bacterium]|nr:3-dehydroquinate synthase II [Desulfobacterales bacterium]